MDRREAILARLLAICSALPGVATPARGLQEITASTRLPALALVDGAEQADDSDPTIRPNKAPRRVTMSPQIVLMAKGAEETIGSTVNGLRAAVAKAIVYDADLLALTLLGEGSARYQGCALELAQGDDAIGTMTLDFSITYVLRMDEL